MPSTKYHRVLLKISGEALASPHASDQSKQGIDQTMLAKLAKDIKSVHDHGIEVCLVVGGGNIFRGVRGASEHGIDRVTSDYMGMLATIINALALQSAIEAVGLPCRVMSAIVIGTIGEPYIRRRALRHLEKGRVVIFAGGTGNPFFTTDMAAALRASEMNCDLLLKATKVNGVYSADPHQDKNAVYYPEITSQDILLNKLEIMDAAAIALARESKIPIAVFSIYDQDGFYQVLAGTCQSTLVHPR